jgi:UDP-GlcNAc3NAcA epimerase
MASHTMKIVTIVGARPQFIKAAAVSQALAEDDGLEEVVVHTGQHFDRNMSDIFFTELEMREPRYNLRIGGGAHGAMTGRMLEKIEAVLLSERPDWVLVYGDTNSTLAGALAAAKLHMPVAHVEAGLRSFNMRMPEEINRVLTDRVSSLLFCPTAAAVDNLRREGIANGVAAVGDVMYDVALRYRTRAREMSTVLARLRLTEGAYVLATCHRSENTDDPVRLKEIIGGLQALARDLPVVLPIHPRTRKLLGDTGVANLFPIIAIEPLSYVDMVALEQGA